MAKKSRIVMVAGSGSSHGSGAHEHPAGCAFLAEQLNKNVDGVEAVVSQVGPKIQQFLPIQMLLLSIQAVVKNI